MFLADSMFVCIQHYTHYTHLCEQTKWCVIIIWMFECWHSYSPTHSQTTIYTHFKLFSILSVYLSSFFRLYNFVFVFCFPKVILSNSLPFNRKCFCYFDVVLILNVFAFLFLFFFFFFCLILFICISMVLDDDSRCTHTLERRNRNCSGETYHICCM